MAVWPRDFMIHEVDVGDAALRQLVGQVEIGFFDFGIGSHVEEAAERG